jgi:hypothetical protein
MEKLVTMRNIGPVPQTVQGFGTADTKQNQPKDADLSKVVDTLDVPEKVAVQLGRCEYWERVKHEAKKPGAEKPARKKEG